MTINYNCLSSILEEALDPCERGTLYAVALELVDKQAVVYTVKRLRKIHNKDVCLLPTFQVGGKFLYKLKELAFT